MLPASDTSEALARSGKWLLPDGVEDLLTDQAASIEILRRRVLDLYASWGYELVVPPMLEFLDSLLTGVGSDLELQTFKVTDQLSGRMLGIRADITPQISRIDAHRSLLANGAYSARNRYCYAGSVLKTRAQNMLASRVPTQSGCELHGEASLAGDIEVLSMMLATLELGAIPCIHLDLAHVGFIRRIMQLAGFAESDEDSLRDVLNRRAVDELGALAEKSSDKDLGRLICALPLLGGSRLVLGEARALCLGDAELLAAIDELQALGKSIAIRYPDVRIRYDLCELRGMKYHTGLMFAAYTEDYGQAVGYGGRYDDIGDAFGSLRPATGFSVDLKVLHKLGTHKTARESSWIIAPSSDSASLWHFIQQLRQSEKVVQLLPGQSATELADRCDRQIVAGDGSDEWRLLPLVAM